MDAKQFEAVINDPASTDDEIVAAFGQYLGGLQQKYAGKQSTSSQADEAEMNRLFLLVKKTRPKAAHTIIKKILFLL